MSNDPTLKPADHSVYLARAKECVRCAHAAATDAEKEAWLKVAEQWLRMMLTRHSIEKQEFQDQLNAKHTGQKNSESLN